MAGSATPTLTEAAIRQLATPESFRRGREYYEGGAVARLTRRGDLLQADVEGSEYAPYQVQISLGPGGVTWTDCTCPYDWGGVCKHVVATLLAYARSTEPIAERPTIETLLAPLNREQLQALVLRLVERVQSGADAVEAEIQALNAIVVGETAEATSTTQPSSAPKPPKQRRTVIDQEVYRRQVRSAIHSLDRMRHSEAYWHVGEVVEEVRRVAEQARPFIEAGDARSALSILEAVTDAYIADWTHLDGSDGETADLFHHLAQLWIETLLSADLTAAERETWGDRLTEWQEEMSDYGVEDAFDVPQVAALQGWDDSALQRVLQHGDASAWRERRDWGTEQVTGTRLAILARQGRTQEYLNLAAAEGLTAHYTTMLVRLGRIEEAVEYGLNNLAASEEALELSRALLEQGATEEAFQIGEYGLKLHGRMAALATWLRDAASASGRRDLALKAAETAFLELPSLASYVAVQELASEHWPDIRERLLGWLRKEPPHLISARVDIFLHEGLVEEAIGELEESPDGFHHYSMVERVADAAIQTHPEWVIHICQKQAERIMKAGKSQHYAHAAEWLRRAREAASFSGRQSEWQQYITGLLQEHKRKYSLVPLLEQVKAGR